MKQDAALATKSRKFRHRLEHTSLVVCGHDRNQNRVRANRARHFIWIDEAMPIHPQERDVEAFAMIQMFEGVEDRVVFRTGADKMAASARVGASEPEHGEVIRFRAAARENQLVRFRAEQLREAIARLVHTGAGFTPSRMHARRIAVIPAKERLHRFPRRGAERRGRVVIEINHRESRATR